MKKLSIFYPPVNELDKNWGLYITTVGFQSILPMEPYPTKGHPESYYFKPENGRILDEFQLLYFTKGHGTFKSKEYKKTSIEEGMVLLSFPNQWHTYTPELKTGWDQYWIGFKGNIASNLVKKHFFNSANMIFKIGYVEELINLYNLAINAAYEENSSFQQYMSGIMMHMLGLIHYSRKNNLFVDQEIINKINKAKVLMREYPRVVLKPEEIAANVNMSYSWFRKMFKKFTGLSPVQYQLQIKVQKAKEYLTASSMSIKEISDSLEFDSVNYFSSFFKNRTKEGPAEFRNRARNYPKNK